jgi:hypothetical protein
MPTASEVDNYTREAASAYRARLREEVDRHGVPELDPRVAGERAAVLTAAGEAWNAEVGPFYDTAGVRAALGGVTRQAVSERTRKRRLLALVLTSDGSRQDRIVYPAWQFRPGVLRRLPAVLSAAGYDPDRPVSGWTIAAWLTQPDPALGGLAPLALLEAGHPDAVLVLAREVRASLGVDELAAARRASN